MWPGTAYRRPDGGALAVPLRDLRLAGSAGPEGTERVLIANQTDEPLWLDAGSMSLRLGDSVLGSVLEVLESSTAAHSFHLEPVLLATLTPIEGGIALETPPGEPTRVALAARPGDTPLGERCATCAPRDDGFLCVRLPSHSISVLRPDDLLVVRFELMNLEILKCCFRGSRLVAQDPSRPAYLIVHLPPQSIAERAFLEAPTGSEEPRISCMESRLAKESRLAFKLKDCNAEIPFDLPSLLRWDPEIWEPSKVPAIRPEAEILSPKAHQTDIEFPWRLHLSPDDGTFWAHNPEPVTRDGRTELWHTRLGLLRPWEAETPTVRAVWADDDTLPKSACPYSEDPTRPFRTSLTQEDRESIVQASHQLGCQPRPVGARLLALSSLGAWSDLRGEWPCTDQPCNGLEKWTHLTTMGRDQKVVVELRAFACRTGHKVILVQETTRELQRAEVTMDGRKRSMFVAFLRQRFYVKVKERKRAYGNWDMHHRSIEILDERTPFINEPNSAANGAVPKNANETYGALAFWPTVGDNVFQFRMKGIDFSGSEQTWLEPLLIIQAGTSAEPSSLTLTPRFLAAIRHYNGSPRRVLQFDGQPIAIAPSFRKGDTEVSVRTASFRVRHLRDLPTLPCEAGYLDPKGAALERHKDPCEPPFWPAVETIVASVPAVEAFLGASKPAQWFPLSIDCDDAFESFAELATKNSTVASFHESSDRSGGSLGPSPAITHLSRRFGPVGLGDKGPKHIDPGMAPAAASAVVAGPLTQVPAADFFDSGATLFGTIELGKIIGAVAPEDGTVPAMLSLLTPFADGPDFLQQSLTWDTTNLVSKEFESILAFERKEGTRFRIDGSFALWIGEPESARFAMQGTLEEFAIRIGYQSAGARVNFDRVTYQALSDGKTSFDLELGNVEFLGALAFIQKLAEKLREFLRKELGVEVDLQPEGLTVWMPPINLPTLNFGMVTIKNLSIRSWVRLPFTPNPVELGFGLGRADAPCELTIGIFGGTAYILVLLDTESGGVRRFEAVLEFGVLREVSFGPAHGRVYLLGGIFFSIAMDRGKRVVVLRAFVRAGGSVDVLGLITAYIDLCIGLRHESTGAQSFLVGEASLTIGFKIVLIKYSARLRRAERIAGSASSGGGQQRSRLFARSALAALTTSDADSCTPIAEPPRLEFEKAICERDWREYWSAFASAEGGLHAA